MSKYTITIEDEAGGVSVGLSSSGDGKTAAYFMAKALMAVVPTLAPAAAEAAAEQGNCPCAKCSVEREKSAGRTLH